MFPPDWNVKSLNSWKLWSTFLDGTLWTFPAIRRPFWIVLWKKAVMGYWGGKYMLLFALWASHNSSYCSFKMFLRFWLVKTTRIIYHIQLLLTKFEKNLGHIEPMTSKVQPAADYWAVERENLGTRFCYFSWAEKQRTKWRLLLQERGQILIG